MGAMAGGREGKALGEYEGPPVVVDGGWVEVEGMGVVGEGVGELEGWELFLGTTDVVGAGT